MRVGFFGFGKMGRAIGAALESQYPNIEIHIYTPSSNTSIEEMPTDLDYYFLAFKPQNLETFHFHFLPGHKIISLLAGVSLDKLISKFTVTKIMRFMPNTPCLYQQGAGLLFYSEYFEKKERDDVEKLLSATGKVFLMENEDQLDRVTGFSGSGPGLIFELARIFEDELNKLTENKLPARDIIAQTFLGASTLMSLDSRDFSELRDEVTSKKGVTFEALEVFKNKNLQSIFQQAFLAAYKRTQDFK